MPITSIISNLKKLLQTSPADIATSLDLPTSSEVGMRHPNNDAYMIVRDDQVVEVAGGDSCALLLDGAQGLSLLKSNAISLEAQAIHLHTPPGGLYFGYQRFNPFWLSQPLDVIGPFWRTAPVVQNAPTSLSAVGVVPAGTLNLITGTPQAGQSIVPVTPLSSFLNAVPLLDVNEQLLILGRNVADLMTMLAGI